MMLFLVRQFAGLLANYRYNTVTGAAIIAMHRSVGRLEEFNPEEFAIAGNL
jgi:hypothetical protein